MSSELRPFAWWRVLVAFIAMMAVGGGTLMVVKMLGDIR